MADSSSDSPGSAMKGLTLTNLPRGIYDHATEVADSYTVALVGVIPIKTGAKIAQIGSATLVKCGSEYGLLTAAHVVQKRAFESSIKIALTVRRDAHSFTIDKDALKWSTVGEGSEEGIGPDLALIVLPRPHAVAIESRKSFWNLDLGREHYEYDKLSDESCIWGVMGYPNESFREEAPTRIAPTAHSLKAELYINVLERYNRAESFDYVEIVAEYNSEDKNPLPKTFGGVSGGGLWKIPLAKRTATEYWHMNPVLAGVAFWQGPLENDERLLRCHGPETIRDHVKGLFGTAA